MTFTARFRAALAQAVGFRTLPVTVLLVLLYLAAILSTLITDQLTSVPPTSTLQSHYGGLNVTEAYKDLHVIAARPHPYNSHANDLVRKYLLQRVKTIQDTYNHTPLVIDDDVVTNGTWSTSLGPGSATYFEGNNILVKIQGTSALPAVLFSAHFDSVSTSTGVTDDGMGIVILLQLIRYFAAHPPHRTVLFNLNNAEEDGLNGAHALLEHPWVKDSSNPEFVNLFGSTFINLEGAGSGGRPLLFRTTDIGSLKSWKNADSPHANIISSEAFSLGIVRSGTDFTVYTNALAIQNPANSTDFAPMRGLDFAFYRGRAKYHTKFDSIPDTEGGNKALWAMMQPSWAAGVALANDDVTSMPSVNKQAVYFDLFNAAFIVFPLSYLSTFNIVAIIVGPIVLVLFTLFESAQSRAAERQVATFSPSATVETEPVASASQLLLAQGVDHADSEDVQVSSSERESGRTMPKSLPFWWKHGQFWVTLLLSIGAQIASVIGFAKLNPLFIGGLILSPPHLITAKPRINLPLHTYKTTNVLAWTSFRTLLIHSYIFSWLIVLVSTVGIIRFGLGGGFYIASIYNALLWVAAVICGFPACFGAAEAPQLEVVHDIGQTGRGDEETEVNERTPLVGRKHFRILKNKLKLGGDQLEDQQPYALWILPLLIVVPFPLILISHVALFLIPSINQTMVDGSPAIMPYATISLLSFLSSLPAMPFIGARKVHRYLMWILGLIWVVCTALAWVPWSGAWVGSIEGYSGGLFPFTENAPFKIFFQQTIELSPSTQNSSSNAKAVTTLTASEPFLRDMVLPLLPSYLNSVASGRKTECSNVAIDTRKTGLPHCSWETSNSEVFHDASSMIHAAGITGVAESATKSSTNWNWTSTTNPWFKAHAKFMSFGQNSTGARFFITANNSRACRVYFDHPVEKLRAYTLNATTDFEEVEANAGWRVQRGFESDTYETLRFGAVNGAKHLLWMYSGPSL
ncbi:hypothetical protein BDP27DRAFT_1415298 [Rhodocollybia butyracea]|uniref:Peptide hydrolase n=1 Tax=Rhodocollybia butyracea TaxID=206335 RepID=A0A9P5Q6Q9_9AGAR|nr:hypothetical protein BDP27DRAFT_1415298 [Rhodocollybia butyracea]